MKEVVVGLEEIPPRRVRAHNAHITRNATNVLQGQFVVAVIVAVIVTANTTTTNTTTIHTTIATTNSPTPTNRS